MPLIKDATNKVFDPEQISAGDLVYAKHTSWTEGTGGFVTKVTDHTLTIQYFPGIGTITNHFMIRVDEVLRGVWDIRWSTDLQEVKTTAGGDTV